VSYQLMPQEVSALVGESGWCKSTTGISILRLIEPTGGQGIFQGEDVAKLSPEELRKKRRDMQFVFQNPYSSLNPRMTVKQLLSEPLRVHFNLGKGETEDRVKDMLAKVGLGAEQLNRYPISSPGDRSSAFHCQGVDQPAQLCGGR
jgi:ABC-type microcin C transport system duplicated ATPase subunit YejF